MIEVLMLITWLVIAIHIGVEKIEADRLAKKVSRLEDKVYGDEETETQEF